MKKLFFVIAISVAGMSAAFSANAVQPSTSILNMDQVVQMKVINDTGADFQYKVGADIYTIVAGTSAGFSFEENTQIMRKNSSDVWVNWFVITTTHQGQSASLTALLN